MTLVAVIVGGVLVLGAVGLGLAGAVVIMRATSDANAKAQVLTLKAAALGAGQPVPEVSSVYVDDGPAPVRAVASRPARGRIELPAAGVHLPNAEPAAEPVARPFDGW